MCFELWVAGLVYISVSSLLQVQPWGVGIGHAIAYQKVYIIIIY